MILALLVTGVMGSHGPSVSRALMASGTKVTGCWNPWSWPCLHGQVLLSWLAGRPPEFWPQVLGPEAYLLALNSATLPGFPSRDCRDSWAH